MLNVVLRTRHDVFVVEYILDLLATIALLFNCLPQTMHTGEGQLISAFLPKSKT